MAAAAAPAVHLHQKKKVSEMRAHAAWRFTDESRPAEKPHIAAQGSVQQQWVVHPALPPRPPALMEPVSGEDLDKSALLEVLGCIVLKS